MRSGGMTDTDTWHFVRDLKVSGSLGSDEYVRGLVEVLGADAWQQFTDPIQGVQTYSSFTQFCLHELGLQAAAVLTMCETTTHTEAFTVAAAIRHGQQLDRTEPKLRARLRKWPDLLRQVDEGLISLQQAALKAGIIKARVNIRTDNSALAVKTLLEHYDCLELLLEMNVQDGSVSEYLWSCGFRPYSNLHEAKPFEVGIDPVDPDDDVIYESEDARDEAELIAYSLSPK
jgi:hypothetical protein